MVLGAGSLAGRLWEIVASAFLGKQKGMLWVESEEGEGCGVFQPGEIVKLPPGEVREQKDSRNVLGSLGEAGPSLLPGMVIEIEIELKLKDPGVPPHHVLRMPFVYIKALVKE